MCNVTGSISIVRLSAVSVGMLADVWNAKCAGPRRDVMYGSEQNRLLTGVSDAPTTSSFLVIYLFATLRVYRKVHAQQ